MAILPVKTYYLDAGFNRIHTNSGSDVNVAVANCVRRMAINQYGAPYAEVFDGETGQLYASVKLKKDGDLVVHHEKDPRAYERKIALSAFL